MSLPEPSGPGSPFAPLDETRHVVADSLDLLLHYIYVTSRLAAATCRELKVVHFCSIVPCLGMGQYHDVVRSMCSGVSAFAVADSPFYAFRPGVWPEMNFPVSVVRKNWTDQLVRSRAASLTLPVVDSVD